MVLNYSVDENSVMFYFHRDAREQDTPSYVNQSRKEALRRQQEREQKAIESKAEHEEMERQEKIAMMQEQQKFLKQQKDFEPSESTVHGKEVRYDILDNKVWKWKSK